MRLELNGEDLQGGLRNLHFILQATGSVDESDLIRFMLFKANLGSPAEDRLEQADLKAAVFLCVASGHHPSIPDSPLRKVF